MTAIGGTTLALIGAFFGAAVLVATTAIDLQVRTRTPEGGRPGRSKPDVRRGPE
jgi:hypothetical protein